MDARAGLIKHYVSRVPADVSESIRLAAAESLTASLVDKVSEAIKGTQAKADDVLCALLAAMESETAH